MTAAPIRLIVIGDQAPKGSSRAVLMHTKAGPIARHIPNGSKVNERKLGGWKTAVTDAWEARKQAAIDGDIMMFTTGPVAIGILFRLALRKGDLDATGAPKATAPDRPAVKPDADKLARSTLDALTTAGAWRDDAQVADLMASRRYVPPGHPTGAVIVIGEDWATVVAMWTHELGEAESTMDHARAVAARAREDARRPRKRKTLADVELDFGVPS